MYLFLLYFFIFFFLLIALLSKYVNTFLCSNTLVSLFSFFLFFVFFLIVVLLFLFLYVYVFLKVFLFFVSFFSGLILLLSLSFSPLFLHLSPPLFRFCFLLSSCIFFSLSSKFLFHYFVCDCCNLIFNWNYFFLSFLHIFISFFRFIFLSPHPSPPPSCLYCWKCGDYAINLWPVMIRCTHCRQISRVICNHIQVCTRTCQSWF